MKRLCAILAAAFVILAPGMAFAVSSFAVDEEGGGVYVKSAGETAVTANEDAALTVPAVDRADIERNEQYRKLMAMKGKKERRKSLSEEAKALRPKALAETATRLGFQQGYAYRYAQIADVLKQRSLLLDSIFNFGPLLLENGKVMPPVIVFADSFAEIRNPDEMVETGVTYKILEPAHFVTVQPSWRDYLLLPDDAVRVEKVHDSMLPLDAAEQLVWQEAISESWITGMEQADIMFQTGVNRMLVDLRGIIQYRILERQGYIAMPQIARGHLSIRVGDENLEFDQRVFRITEKARFKEIDRKKKTKVDLTKPQTKAGQKAARRPVKRPVKKSVAKPVTVKKPANTGPKLSLPSQQREIEVFVETPASSVDIRAKGNMDPADVAIEVLKKKRAATAESPEAMQPPYVMPIREDQAPPLTAAGTPSGETPALSPVPAEEAGSNGAANAAQESGERRERPEMRPETGVRENTGKGAADPSFGESSEARVKPAPENAPEKPSVAPAKEDEETDPAFELDRPQKSGKKGLWD